MVYNRRLHLVFFYHAFLIYKTCWALYGIMDSLVDCALEGATFGLAVFGRCMSIDILQFYE